MNRRDELSEFDEALDCLLEGSASADDEADPRIQAARAIIGATPAPSPEFVETLRARLMEHGRSHLTRPGNGRATFFNTLGGPFHIVDTILSWCRAHPVATAAVTVLFIVVIVGFGTPPGRAAARDIAETLGLRIGDKPNLPPEGGSPMSRSRLGEIERTLGFKVRFPSYVPEGIFLSRVTTGSGPSQNSPVRLSTGDRPTVQIDYVFWQDPGRVAITIKQSRHAGEPLVVTGPEPELARIKGFGIIYFTR